MKVILLPVYLFALYTHGGCADPIVYPVFIKSRSGASGGVLRVSQEVVLNLEKGTILGDSLFFSETVNGEVRHELIDIEELEESLYQSTEHMASLTLTESEDGLVVRGLINSTHGIEPLATEKTNNYRTPHRIFPLLEPNSYDEIADENTQRIHVVPEERGDSEDLPPVVRPELYAVIDRSYHRHFNGSRKRLAQYVTQLLNCVNLIFTKMVNPTIRLQLVGIRCLDEDEENVVLSKRDGYIDTMETLNNFADYTNKSAFPRAADMFLLLVGSRLAGFENNNEANPFLLGRAFLGSVCVPGANVAVVEDPPGTYGGFLTAAHELGHILGALHDGSPAPDDVPEYPSSSACPNNGGFLMSSPRSVKGPQTFSSCSEEQIRFLLKWSGRDCWETKTDYNFFSVNTRLAETVSPETFCRGRYGAWHHSASIKDCIITCKFKYPPTSKRNSFAKMEYNAPFGYFCGKVKEKICMFTKCIDWIR